MKVLFLAALLWLGASPALAAPVELPVNLEDGDSWLIETQRVRTTDDDGKTSEIRSESRSRATLKVGDESATLVLSPLPGYASADLPPELRGFGLDFPLEFEVDAALTPVRMTNWPRLRETMLRFFDSQPADPAFAQAVKTMYTGFSEETAAGLFAPHQGFLGIGQGLSVEVGKPVTYEDEVANPLGGRPIASRGSLVLESYDRKTKRAVAVWTQTLDPQSMAASVRETSKALAQQRSDPRAASDSALYDQMRVDRSDRCRFDLDVASGLAVRTECSSVVKIAAPGHHLNRTDTWTITQTLPKAR